MATMVNRYPLMFQRQERSGEPGLRHRQRTQQRQRHRIHLQPSSGRSHPEHPEQLRDQQIPALGTRQGIGRQQPRQEHLQRVVGDPDQLHLALLRVRQPRRPEAQPRKRRLDDDAVNSGGGRSDVDVDVRHLRQQQQRRPVQE